MCKVYKKDNPGSRIRLMHTHTCSCYNQTRTLASAGINCFGARINECAAEELLQFSGKAIIDCYIVPADDAAKKGASTVQERETESQRDRDGGRDGHSLSTSLASVPPL